MKQVNRTDLQIYSSNSQTTDVTIGEWKNYRKTNLKNLSGRLCTYADLVCDYIKMDREILMAMGINQLPSSSASAIDAIVVKQGRECVPFSTASTPVALNVYLSKNSLSEVFIGFNFSGEYGQFPEIKCDETYFGLITVEYDYNTIVSFSSVNIDKLSDNINKILCIELNNFDLVPFIATNTPTAYKNAGHSWDESLNINGTIEFNRVISTEISSQRKLYFNIKGGTSSQYPNPDTDQLYQYNLFSIIKFGGFSRTKVPGYYSGIIYGIGVTQYYNGLLEQYKKEYSNYPFVKGGDYDYGGRLTLSYMPYNGSAPVEYDLWSYFNDNISSTTMCPQTGYFEPAMLTDGVATITVTGVKNHSVRVMVQTDGNAIVRNISNINVPSTTDYDVVKMYGKPIILITDTYGTADSDITNPGLVKLGVLPAEKPKPFGMGAYDRFKVTFYENGSQIGNTVTFKFSTDGYVLDVNRVFLGSSEHPLKANATYLLIVETMHKYVPKVITFRVFKEILFKISNFTVNGTLVEAVDSGSYWDYKYNTKESDPEKTITVTFGQFDRPSQSSPEWSLWQKFFRTPTETGQMTPAEYQMIRISLNNGRYNSNASFTYYPSSLSPSPTSTRYIQFNSLKFINGDTEQTATPIPRNTNLFIRTLGRIVLNVRLYSLYSYTDEFYKNKSTSSSYTDFETYITSEEISSGFVFKMVRLNGGNNTIRPRVNYVSIDSDTYDSNVVVFPYSSIKFNEVGEEIEITVKNIDVMRPKIYLILQSVQTSLMTVNIIANENLQYVRSNYTLTDVPTRNTSPAVYIGLQHYSNSNILLGVSKVSSREMPYSEYPSKDNRKYSDGMYTYEFDIETTKWRFALERVYDSMVDNFQRTTLLKQINLSGDIVDSETEKTVTVSDSQFNMNNSLIRYQTFNVSNKTGIDSVTITMTPVRWNIARLELSIKKTTLKYDPSYGKCWLQPSLINPYGQTFDSAINWTSHGDTEECWFYVPEYNDFSGSEFYPANATGEHRRVWIKFTPSYKDGSDIKPIPSSAQTTLIGYSATFIDDAGSSSQSSYNLGNVESTLFDSTTFNEVRTRLGKTQHDRNGGIYKFKVEFTPIEGEPHMILVGVVINGIRYMADDFITNPPVIPQTMNTAINFYLYCPYIHSGQETGNFTGGIPYNNVFTHTDGITSTTPGDLNGRPYTHIFTFRNNVSKDFYELNEQYPSNGVGSRIKYRFSVALTLYGSSTYTQDVECLTSTIGQNILESDKLSILPDIGEKMTVNAWTWVWVSTDISVPKNVQRQKKYAISQSSTQPWFHYEFIGAPSGVTPENIFNITSSNGVYTFEVKTRPPQSYMLLRMQLQYQEMVSSIGNKQLDVAIATKMMPYKVMAYNGSVLEEDYKYIYPMKRDGSDGVIYIQLNCPQIEVDGGQIIVSSPNFIGSTIDRSTSPNYNRVVRFTNNQNYWDKVNPQSFDPLTDPYENREVTLELEYRSNDLPEYPKLSYVYYVGAFGDFELSGDSTSGSNPGDSYHVTVIRKAYTRTGYKRLNQEDGDFPFSVDFGIREPGYNFYDYFTVSYVSGGSYTITVKNDVEILIPFTAYVRPKMVSNDFRWIQTPAFDTLIDVKLYINLFTNQSDLGDSFFFLTPFEYNIFIKTSEGSNIFRLNDKTINGVKYYFVSLLVKKENGVVKLYRMTSPTEYVPIYMSVGYGDPSSANTGSSNWENIIDSNDYTSVSHDGIVDDYITLMMNSPQSVGSPYQNVYVYPLGFISTSQTIKSKVQVNWGLVKTFAIGPTMLSKDTFWNYWSQSQVDAELG